ncbi:MAG TPA: alpha/beta fold hydrolase, partial [Chromatiaceae bacterium]|nr:alpha/beta fold hydrolase [Chromatiaceae bacterium]
MTALLLAGVGALALALLPALLRYLYRAPRTTGERIPADLGLHFREIHLETKNGKRLFSWYLPPPKPNVRASAVAILHGWGGCSAHMLPFAALLQKAGHAVLLLDARNHGRSDDDKFSSMPRFAEDLEQGLDWLRQQPEVERIHLLGHSVGAAACLLLASRREDVASVVSIASFAHPEALMRRQMAAHHVPYRPVGWLVLKYIEHLIGYRFDDIAPCNTIRRIRCPVLLVHGEEDEFVPVEDAQTIFAKDRKST